MGDFKFIYNFKYGEGSFLCVILGIGLWLFLILEGVMFWVNEEVLGYFGFFVLF